MFVTASSVLKFHHWPNEGFDEVYNSNIVSPIVCLSWSNDNNFLIHLQEGGRLEILSLKDINNIKVIHVITAIDKASAVTFQRGTKRVVGIGTSSSTVALYDTRNKSIIKLFTVRAPVTHLDFNSTDEYLAVACEDGTISLLNINDGNESCTYTVGCQPSELRFHQTYAEVFAVGTKDGTLFKFHINQPNPTFVERCHFGSINGIVYSIKHDLLITVGEDYKFCAHDMKKNICVYRGHLQFPLTSIDITPDGKHIAIGTDRGAVYIYETKNLLTPLVKWSPHTGRVKCIKFSNKKIIDAASKTVVSEESVTTTETMSPEKLREENDFKCLYNKFINKSDDDDFLNVLRDDMLSNFRRDTAQLHIQMKVHMASLQDFIKKEFDKMTEEMDEKWNVLRLVAERYKHVDDVGADDMFYLNDEPVILE